MYLTQVLHRGVQQYPGRVATICGARRRTTAESVERIAKLAGALRGLGVSSGDRVAIMSLNSDRYHELLFAVPWADAVINPINIRLSAGEVAYCLKDCDTRVLVVDDTFAPLVDALRSLVPDLRDVIFCGDGPTPAGMSGYEDLIGSSAPVEDARRGGRSVLGVFYTGGTTGSPKGVMLSHDNIFASSLGALGATDIVKRGGTVLHAAPMFHLADLAMWHMGTLLGLEQVFVPQFAPGAVAAAIEEHRVTDILLVPTMIQMLVDSPDTAQADLGSLRRITYGGSPISQGVLERARKRLDGVAFTQAYGMTELAPVATVLGAEDHDRPALTRSAGRAGATMEVDIVDPEDRSLPRGRVGEVVVRGDNVMLGYWNRPEETAEALRGGWMHTGDSGYLDDEGYLFIVDRIKDMIVTGGENVYSTEVENALSQHPAVASCAVIAVPDERWGERVHAVVVTTPGVEVTADELREFCREHIANYKLPRSIEFRDTLPLSAAGKVLKRELRAVHWAGAARHVG